MTGRVPSGVVALSILAICLLGFLGCGGRVDPHADGDRPVVDIGLISSRSGGAAAYGEDAYRGAMLALESRREELPFTPRIHEGDDRSTPSDAQRLAVNMLNLNDVDVMFGPVISPSAVVVGKMMEEKGVPMVTPSATQDEVVVPEPGKVLEQVTQVCFNDGFQGRALARFARSELGLERVLIVVDQAISYSVGLANSFEKEFEVLGGEIVGREAYSVSDADFSALIRKISSSAKRPGGPEGLFIPGWDENVGPMLRQAGDQWSDLMLLGGDGWPTHKLLELSAGFEGQAFAMAHFAADRPDPQLQKFIAAFEERYGEAPTPHAALGYDAMTLILEAIERVEGNYTAANISAKLRTMGTVDLLTGRAEIPEEGGFTRKEGIIVRMEPDGFTFVKAIEPASAPQ